MVKRKFDDDLALADDSLRTSKRQFLSLDVQSMDVDMTVDEPSPVTAGTSESSPVYMQVALPSNEAQPSYPDFSIYPLPGMDVDSTSSSTTSSTATTPAAVGLLQPQSHAGGSQHGPHCVSIPKLRMSCSAGIFGRRTMWTHCESCGAIEMVE